MAALEGFTAEQVDPSFLAELPEQVRLELLREMQEVAARRERQQQQQRQQQQGGRLGSAAGNAAAASSSRQGDTALPPQPQHPQGPLFANGRDPGAVRATVTAMFAALAASTAAAEAGIDAAAGPAPPSLGRLPSATTSGPVWAAPLLEMCVAWLLSLDGRLDEQTKGLRLLVRVGARHAGELPELAALCEAACEAVQVHLEAKFGFRMQF